MRTHNVPSDHRYLLKCVRGVKGITATVEVDGVAHEAWSVVDADCGRVRELYEATVNQCENVEISAGCRDCFPEWPGATAK